MNYDSECQRFALIKGFNQECAFQKQKKETTILIQTRLVKSNVVTSLSQPTTRSLNPVTHSVTSKSNSIQRLIHFKLILMFFFNNATCGLALMLVLPSGSHQTGAE